MCYSVHFAADCLQSVGCVQPGEQLAALQGRQRQQGEIQKVCVSCGREFVANDMVKGIEYEKDKKGRMIGMAENFV